MFSFKEKKKKLSFQKSESNTDIPVADSCWGMAKPIQYCKVISLQLNKFILKKKSACNAGDLGLIPGSGRSPGEGPGNPRQCSCLENPRTEEPGGLQSRGSRRAEHSWAVRLSLLFLISSAHSHSCVWLCNPRDSTWDVSFITEGRPALVFQGGRPGNFVCNSDILYFRPMWPFL